MFYSPNTRHGCQNVSRGNVHISMALTEINVFRSDAGPWSYSLPAARTINSCSGSPPHPPGPAGSSRRLRPSPSPRTPPRTAGASSPSTSPSSPGAKLLTWLPSAAPQTAMQACTRPCPHSARPPWTSTSCTCPAPSPARSRTRARATRRTRQKTAPRPNKVGSTGAGSPPRRILLTSRLMPLTSHVILSQRRSLGAGGERQRPEPERRGRTRGFAHQVADHPEKRQMQKLFRYTVSQIRLCGHTEQLCETCSSAC